MSARVLPRSPLGSLQRSLDPAGGLRMEGTEGKRREWKEGRGRNGEESWKDEGVKEGRDEKGKREARKGMHEVEGWTRP